MAQVISEQRRLARLGDPVGPFDSGHDFPDGGMAHGARGFVPGRLMRFGNGGEAPGDGRHPGGTAQAGRYSATVSGAAGRAGNARAAHHSRNSRQSLW